MAPSPSPSPSPSPPANDDDDVRPSLSRVLQHTFLSGRTVTRLVGAPAVYDIYVSYRRSVSDRSLAETVAKQVGFVGLGTGSVVGENEGYMCVPLRLRHIP